MNVKKIAYWACCLLIAGYICFRLVTLASASNGSWASIFNPDSPRMQFLTEEYNFGTIDDGQAVKYYFRFSNKGKSPLIIYNVTTTCGCTIASWPHKPVAPEATDSIGIAYQSHGNLGYTDKIITIKSNADRPEKKLVFAGRVIKYYKRNNGPNQRS